MVQPRVDSSPCQDLGQTSSSSPPSHPSCFLQTSCIAQEEDWTGYAVDGASDSTIGHTQKTPTAFAFPSEGASPDIRRVHSSTAPIVGRDPVSAVLECWDLKRQIFEELEQEAPDDRRHIGRACALVSRSFFQFGMALVWNDLSDYPL